jgi:hypothetical protein
MKKSGIASKPKSKRRAMSKNRRTVVKPIRTDEAKPDFIGRLKGVFRIVGDIESPVVPPEAWEYD